MAKKIGLGIVHSANVSAAEQIKIFKESGFDAFFSDYRCDDTVIMRHIADKIGIEYQSVHAPFYKMHLLWEPNEKADTVKAELIECAHACSQSRVPIMVVHPFIGFDKNSPTRFGIEKFREVVVAACELGVKVAFENVEGDKYLAALMEEFRGYENVGFCWDAGHEMCYNRGEDMLCLYGERLIATHINDNLGVRGEKITPDDDLHLLPFDGKKDWADAALRLRKTGFDGVLTFELKMNDGIDKMCGTHYCEMDFRDYVSEAYNRALRFREMLENQ